MTHFRCPKCGGPYFGRDVGPDGPLPSVRCHGESSDGPGRCDWRGVWPDPIDAIDEIEFGTDDPTTTVRLHTEPDEPPELVTVFLSPTYPDHHRLATIEIGMGGGQLSISDVPLAELEKLGRFLATVARRWRA